MSLLTLENIVKGYRNQNVLNGVSLRVEKGERLALVGPNGAGKTTLLKIAMGLESSDEGSVITARNIKVGYLSQDLKDLASTEKNTDTSLHYEKVYRYEQKLRELEKELAAQSQDSDSAAYKHLMAEYSRLLQIYESMDGYTIETKIKKILLGLGLRQETLGTPLEKLSGGERMRVSVARILLEEPDLLILDEPTNHLDLQATEWFESFLKKFEGGILLVSHDRYFLDRIATRVAELDKGSLLIRSGNYSNFMEHKKQLSQFVLNEQARLKWTIKNAHETVQGLKSQRKIKAIKSREKEIQKLNEELKVNLEAIKKQDHLFQAEGPKIAFKKIKHVSKDIARAEDLGKSFGAVSLFSGVNFHIRGGEKIGIIGANGCGKTTLINLLLGKDQVYQGSLRLGEWVKYSYMGQEILFENDNLTMLQLILAKADFQEGEARNYLARFQFYGDEVQKKICVLSGGELARLYLACVMLENADCLILDEPTNHLDVAAREAVEAAVREFKGTLIAVTHDRYFLTHCVEKIYAIEDGRLNICDGNYDFFKQIKDGINGEGQSEKMDRPGEKPQPAPIQSRNRPKSDYRSEHKKKNQQKNTEKQKQNLAAQIELEITELEGKIKELENLFDQTTPLEKYQEYDELLKEVDRLYHNWSELAT